MNTLLGRLRSGAAAIRSRIQSRFGRGGGGGAAPAPRAASVAAGSNRSSPPRD